MRSYSFTKLTILAATTALTTSLPAFAEEADSDLSLEEIVVTAQKREQSIEDVPITVSALSGKTLEDLGIDRFDSLSDLVPGLVVQQQSINNNGYVIRGITSDDGSSDSAPRVSVYLNGADVSRSRGSYFEVYDMERIEVVKGPQATLFGTAASIGAMSFITAKPQEKFSAQVKGGIGNYGLREATGYVTGGNDKVQGRLAFFKKKRDGYVNNTSGEDDLNGINRFAIRPSLRFTPSDNVTVDLVYNYEEADDTGTAFVNKSVLFTDNASLSAPDVSNLGDDKLGVDRKTHDVNLTTRWDIDDNFALTYIGAYRHYYSNEVFDADGTQYEFLNFAEKAYGDQTSHELRLSYSDDKINSFFGISYFDEDATQSVPFTSEEGTYLSCLGVFNSAGITGCNTSATSLVTGGALTNVLYEGSYTNHANNSQISAFGDVSYKATDRLEVTAGLRYIHEKRKSTYLGDMPNSTLLGLAGTQSDLLFGAILNTDGEKVSGNLSDDVFLPRFNLLYSLTDTMNAYATVAKGQRSQVIDMSSGTARIIPAEKVTNYEMGIKGNALDNSVQYALSVFYQDYKNFQVTFTDATSGQSRTENAGNATNIGVEGEITWKPADGLTLMTNVAYIDAGINDTAKNGNYAGHQFRLQPKWTGAVSYIYRTAITEGIDFKTSGSWSYRSSVYFDIQNNYEEKAVDLLNMRIGIAASDDNWSASIFGSNLLNKDYIMDAGNTGSAFGYPTYIQGASRMYGIEVVKRF